VSLLGAKLQAKSCVLCGEKREEKPLWCIHLIFTTEDTGEHRVRKKDLKPPSGANYYTFSTTPTFLN